MFKKLSQYMLLMTMFIFSHQIFAEETVKVNIAKLPDAQVFASFTDELPAVVNYFTSASKKDIVAFYQKIYGDIINQETKRKRLTITFFKNEQHIRIVISQQNNKRQVDVLIHAA